MEDPESKTMLNFQGLYGHLKKRLHANKINYIFIDEIQQCEKYKNALEGLIIKKNIDLYITTSTSGDLSGVPCTEFRILPLSLAEYRIISANLIKNTPQKAYTISSRRLPRQKAQLEKYYLKEVFTNYLSFGGLPYAASLNTDSNLTHNCVEGIYNTVLVKNIAYQAGINNIPLLEQTARLMSHSIGRPLSTTKTAAAISANGKKISSNTIETYIRALTGAFIFYHAGRFDIKTGKQLKTLGKYYIADPGIRNLLLETTAPELDSQLENMVFLELLRRGFEVFTGKYGNEEVNFVAMKPCQKEMAAKPADESLAYYQVTATARKTEIFTAKAETLMKIPDSHPKYILSLDEMPYRSAGVGIIQDNLVDWLLKR